MQQQPLDWKEANVHEDCRDLDDLPAERCEGSFFFGLSDERWVNEPSTDIGKTSNVANYSTEEVGTVPGSSECGDPPGTISADSSASTGFSERLRLWVFTAKGIISSIRKLA